MAAAMASCRVVGGVEGVASLLPPQIRGAKARRSGSCNARILGGGFGGWLRIGRERTASVASNFVTLPLVSQVWDCASPVLGVCRVVNMSESF